MAVKSFLGVSKICLDAKSRLAIPTKYRALLEEKSGGKEVIITVNLDGCLAIYPVPVWNVAAAALQALPGKNLTTRNIKRRILGYVEELTMDGQGRLTLTSGLLEFAGIEKNMVLVGQQDKFEVWSEERWQEVVGSEMDNEEEVEENVLEILGQFGGL